MRRSIGIDVSRETLERLEDYEALLHKWNPRINLVSKTTLADAWTRHFVDSAQLFELADGKIGHWADLGSGGGFPGLVIAILAAEHKNLGKMTLVEADRRKSLFLQAVLRETGVDAQVVTDRIEATQALEADIISARALADLSTLIGYADKHLSKDGTAILPKGENWEKELQQAQSKWQFEHRVVKSKTSDGPVIICVEGVSSV